MLIEHEGRRPQVADSAYVAPNAVLCGDVRVGADSRILFGAVLTAQTGTIEVGERCIVMENALLRGRESHPAAIGDHVLVGPHAHVNGACIEREVFLATGVSVFPGARIESGSSCGKFRKPWTFPARSSASRARRPAWPVSAPAMRRASAATAGTGCWTDSVQRSAGSVSLRT
jgi:acetyltransferase-like isoleucine patch superfamily enzyme